MTSAGLAGCVVGLIRDWCKGYERDVARLLDQGVPVLVYAGDQDFMCNHYGNRAWTQGLRWSGHQHFKRVGRQAGGQADRLVQTDRGREQH